MNLNNKELKIHLLASKIKTEFLTYFFTQVHQPKDQNLKIFLNAKN